MLNALKIKAGEKKKRAAAISYNPDVDDVPVLSAFGEGYVAEKIVSKGMQSGIPVVSEPELLSMLTGMSVGDDIPPSLYEVVAKILVFVSDINSSIEDKMKRAVHATQDNKT